MSTWSGFGSVRNGSSLNAVRPGSAAKLRRRAGTGAAGFDRRRSSRRNQGLLCDAAARAYEALESRLLMTIVQQAGQDYLSFEAEHPEAVFNDLDGDGGNWTRISGAAAAGANSGPSGGAALEAIRVPSGGVSNDEGQVEYPIQLTNAGPYLFYARVKYTNSGGDNSIYLPPNGGDINADPTVQWDNRGDSPFDYHWNNLDVNNVSFSYTNPTPGQPTTLKVAIREDHYILDRIVLSETPKNANQLEILGAPAAPTAFAGNNRVALQFPRTASGTTVNIRRGTSATGPFTPIGTSTSGSFLDTTAVNGTQYFYVISISNPAGESPISAPTAVTPSATAAPAAPTNVTVQQGPGSNQATVSFTAVPFATRYNIYRSDTATGTFTNIGNTTGTSFVDAGPLTAGEDYFYVVRAVSDANIEGAASSPAVSLVSGRGARGSYFNDSFWGSGNRSSARRQLETFRPGPFPDATQYVPQVNFDWGSGSPHPNIRPDFHSTVFTGKVTIPQDFDSSNPPGSTISVTFVNSSDDDGIIFVNGFEAAEHMGPPGHGQEDRPGTPLELVEGQSYNFVVMQAEQGGGSGVRFKWVNPATGANEVIPQQYLTPVMDRPATPTLSDPVASDPAAGGERMVRFTINEPATNHGAELWFELLRDGVVVATSELTGTDFDGDPTNGIQSTIADSQPTPGPHQYTVRAVNYDAVGDQSAAVNFTVPATFYPAAEPNGASAYYINSQSWNGGRIANGLSGGRDIVLAGPPDYHEIVPTVDKTWGESAPALEISNQFFSTVHTGEVLIPADFDGDGTPNESNVPVQFVGNTDDHGIYFVNGQVAAVSFILRGEGDYTGAPPMNLTEGQRYDFVIFQSEHEGGAGVHFKWANPVSGFNEVIPTENLFHRTGAPAAPATATGTGLGNIVVVNFADTATNELHYLIERSTSAGGPFTTVGMAPINATSFADTTVAQNTTYFYRVSAVNYEGRGSTTTAAVVSGVPQVPAAPTITSGVARRAGPRIGFTDNSINEADFLVQRRLASETDAAFSDVGTVAASAAGSSGGTLYFQDTSGVAGQNYVYRVIARNAAGQGVSNNFALNNTPGAGTGLQATYFDQYFNSRQAFIDNAESGVTFLDPVPAAETYGGGAVGPAGLGGIQGTGGPSGRRLNPDTNQPEDVTIDAETFSGLFTGFFIPDVSGSYTFQSNSDDGVSVEITDPGPNGTFGDADDVVLIDFNGITFLRPMSEGFADVNGTVNVVAGRPYQLRLLMSENTGGAGYRFGYFNPTTGLEAFPTELLFPTLPGAGISEVYVRGTAWNQNFKNYLETQGLGDDQLGYRVDNRTGAQSILPWINVNEIVLRYSSPPTGQGIPTPGTVVLDGDREDYQVTAVTNIDAQTFVLTLNRPLGNLAAGGENGVKVAMTVPASGPGGGPYMLTLNALQGDVNRSGSVLANDYSEVKARFFQNPTTPSYTAFHDVDGSGSILANDYSAVKARFFDNFATPVAPVTAARASITRELFSSRRVLG